MSALLRIDASPRTEGSKSRALGDHAEAQWTAGNPGGHVHRRDVSGPEIPPIKVETITGFYTPADGMTDVLREATALSDTLIAELQSADCLLISTPMYNFGVPAGLKAWIDQVTRIGHTFAYEDENFRGLVRTPRAIVVCAYGAQGYAKGGPLESADFVRPYLDFLLKFWGIQQVEFVAVEGTAGDDAAAASMAGARESIDRLLLADAA